MRANFVSFAVSVDGGDDAVDAHNDAVFNTEGWHWWRQWVKRSVEWRAVEWWHGCQWFFSPVPTKLDGELGKRRCIGFVVPSVDLLATLGGQKTELDCKKSLGSQDLHRRTMGIRNPNTLFHNTSGNDDSAATQGQQPWRWRGYALSRALPACRTQMKEKNGRAFWRTKFRVRRLHIFFCFQQEKIMFHMPFTVLWFSNSFSNLLSLLLFLARFYSPGGG